jgi:hypothetical protein
MRASTLVFSAAGCRPGAWRPLEHDKVQRALGALQAEREGPLAEALSQRTIFEKWRLLLARLELEMLLEPATPSEDGGAGGAGGKRP